MNAVSLEILGLRGFAEPQLLNFAHPNGDLGSGLTILVGPNNGGKSTVLEAVRAFSGELPTFHEGKRNRSAGDLVRLKLTTDDNQVHTIESRAAGECECKRTTG